VDVTTAERAGWRASDLARAYLDGGARVLQVRAKDLPPDAFLALCDDVVRAAAAFDADVIINDRVDLARMSGAAGVHVGQGDIPPAAARAQLGPRAIVGCSTHTVLQVEEALRQPITYLAIGPVFGTSTKETGYAAVGLEMVRAAAERARGVPIIAIGGITLDRAPAVLEAGAAAVAVIGDLMTGGDPKRRTEAYRKGLL
jgi:thiamine-phosphate pyrophosphorylase